MAEVKTLLGRTRLLTLTGMGGSGKTRLSLQVAADLLDGEGDGVWLVELAALPDPALVPQAVADVLGVKEQPGQPAERTLIDWLKVKRLLVVLDNCEHLAGACASLAAAILKSCPGVRLMASSRESLNVAGEQVYRVPALAQSDAVRLFAERAQAVHPSFAVTNANAPAVSAVCSRLDGIPLALELAAARVRSLTVEDINARLDSRFRLLTGGSWTALRRLSAFTGGWTLEAAAAVCAGKSLAGKCLAGDDVEDWKVLDLLTSLLDKSLVVYDTEKGRYGLLETVRQYAKDRLEEEGEADAVQARAAAWFLELAEKAEPNLQGPEQAGWLSRLETDHDNLRAALAWCEQAAEGVEPGLSLAGMLWRFWVVRGHVTEGRYWLGRVLERIKGREDTTDEKTQEAAVMAFYFAGSLAILQNDYAAAEAMLRKILEIWQRQGKQRGVAAALGNLGMVAQRQGDYAAAQELFAGGLAVWRQLGDSNGVAGSLNNLGDIAKSRGDYPAARLLLEEGLALARQQENTHLAAMLLDNLGIVALRQGSPADARSLLADSLGVKRGMGDNWGMAYSLESMAEVAQAQKEYEKSAHLLGAAARVREGLGMSLPAGEQEASAARAAAARAARTLSP